MEYIKIYKKYYPTSYKILVVLLLILLFYKFGYVVGKFIANMGFWLEILLTSI